MSMRLTPTLTGSYCRDPQILERELERIFYRSWVLAGREERVAERGECSVEANWKILVENFMACYHCPGVHPELIDLVPLYRTGEVDTEGSEPPEYREVADVTRWYLERFETG